MATDLTVGLVNQPGTLLSASDALARAGINIEGACGYVCEGRGVYHVLVEETERARRALIDAGFEIQAERSVLITPIENRPGSAAAVLRRELRIHSGGYNMKKKNTNAGMTARSASVRHSSVAMNETMS